MSSRDIYCAFANCFASITQPLLQGPPRPPIQTAHTSSFGPQLVRVSRAVSEQGDQALNRLSSIGERSAVSREPGNRMSGPSAAYGGRRSQIQTPDNILSQGTHPSSAKVGGGGSGTAARPDKTLRLTKAASAPTVKRAKLSTFAGRNGGIQAGDIEICKD